MSPTPPKDEAGAQAALAARCHQCPRGGEGQGTTNLATAGVRAGWSPTAGRRGQEPHSPSPEPGATGFLVQNSLCLGRAAVSDASTWGFSRQNSFTPQNFRHTQTSGQV